MRAKVVSWLGTAARGMGTTFGGIGGGLGCQFDTFCVKAGP